MGEESGNKGVQILTATCMIIGALLVILTCIWKLIKLVAMYKMESRIEDLERLSAAQNNGSVAPADISGMMSPKEARSLRKLSILAGFDRRPARSARSSISAGGNSTNSAFAGVLKRGSSPLRRMADLLGHPRKNSAPYQVANHSTSNGRLAPNFLLPPDAHNRGFMMDCLSPNGHTVNGINHHPHESECSPVLGHKTAPNSCAIHGLSSSASASRLLNSKVSIACQTVTPLSPPVHLTPPAGFDVDDECISPSSENCDSPMNSWRGTAVDLHHHVHHVQPIHRKKSPQQQWMRCINPNHFHHHHHHHDPPTLPITLTHNPIEDNSSSGQQQQPQTTAAAALLFHPPQYQCAICQHNASLYRALSNPNLLARPHSSAAAAANASSSHGNRVARDSHKDQMELEDSPDDTETENPNEDLGCEEDEEEDMEELTPPPPLQLDLKMRPASSHRMASMGSAKDLVSEANLRDISGLREPLYSDLKSSLNRLNNTVHWKSSTLERKKSSDN